MRYTPFSAELFKKNRAKLYAQLPPKSIVIVSSNDIMPTNADGTMGFRQNSDLFYLSGLDQEETLLILYPDAPEAQWREIAFVLIPKGTKSVIPWFSSDIASLSISTRDLEKLLRSLGYSKTTGGKGSHQKFVHEFRPMIILPNAREALSPGVLRSVANSIGVSSIRELVTLV